MSPPSKKEIVIEPPPSPPAGGESYFLDKVNILRQLADLYELNKQMVAAAAGLQFRLDSTLSLTGHDLSSSPAPQTNWLRKAREIFLLLPQN